MNRNVAPGKVNILGPNGKIVPQSRPMPLVCIGVPCGDRVHKEFSESLWGLGRGARFHRQGLSMAQSSIVAHGRNNLVEAMKAMKADWLMFIDSDMVFPWNTVDRLLAHDLDIVGGTYVRRGPPFDNMGHPVSPADRDAKTGLIEMTHMPTGMLLIRAKVFDSLKKPYFRFETNEEEKVVRGEDFVFSEAVRAAGYKLWCDVDLSHDLLHMYQCPLGPTNPTTREMAENFAKNQTERETREAAHG